MADSLDRMETLSRGATTATTNGTGSGTLLEAIRRRTAR
jgi:hypothetical protein